MSYVAGAVFFLVAIYVSPMNCALADDNSENCRALLQRTLDFDYLGAEYTYSNTCQKLYFHPLILKVEEREYVLRKSFQKLLEEFENRFLCGDLNGCMDKVVELDNFLHEYIKDKKSNWRVVLRFLQQYEYSVVRMLLHDACSSNKAFRLIEVALDFVVSREMLRYFADNKEYLRVKIFKEMITIGIEIERMRKIGGELPKTLSEISGEAAKDKLEYSVKDGKWQLFNPIAVKSNGFSPFNVYVPSIEYVSSVPRSACLWLSSDFAKKRRELYQGKIINRGNKGWECFMKQGKLHMLK